jgi:hypothetical protein
MFGFIMIAFMSFINLYRVRVTNKHWYVWFVLIAVHFICLRSSWLITMCDIWPLLASAEWWMPLLEQDLIYNLESFCLTPVLMALLLLKLKFLMRNTDHCLLFVLSLSLTFVLRYVGSGYTNVVFRLSLCLLSLNLSLYLVRI